MARPFPGFGGALALLGAAVTAQLGVAWALRSLFPGLSLVLLTAFTNLVALTAAAAAGYVLAGDRPRWKRFGGQTWWAGLLLAAAGGTVVLGEVANYVSALAPLSPELARLLNELLDNGPAPLFAVALVAPFTEELLFRGVLLRGFAQRWDARTSLLLSSLLFAAFHLNIWQAPSAFLAGLLLGWLYLKSGSLGPPMVAHGVFNGLPLVLAAAGFQVRGYNTPAAAAVEFQPVWWLVVGAAALVAGLPLLRKAALSPPPVSDTVAP